MAAETTQIKMINAAGELAAERGLDNVSTRAVADRAGENIGSIHYHFGGKDGLFEAVAREAIGHCKDKDYSRQVEHLNESATPAELSAFLRKLVSEEITDLFRTNRPLWHTQVIYQLLQRDDALYELFRAEVLDPSMDVMAKFFKLLDPAMPHDEIHLRICLLKMPIFAHANYMKAMLKRLNRESYSEEYLQQMEDLLVKQTQLLLGLPEDK